MTGAGTGPHEIKCLENRTPCQWRQIALNVGKKFPILTNDKLSVSSVNITSVDQKFRCETRRNNAREERKMANTPKSSTSSNERRPKRRQRVLLGGIVAFADGSQSFKCLIRDVSETGARVFPRGQQVPSDFYLIHMRDRLAYEAKVVWTNGKEVGVLFKKHIRLADIVDPTKHFLTRLWFDQVSV